MQIGLCLEKHLDLEMPTGHVLRRRDINALNLEQSNHPDVRKTWTCQNVLLI